MIVQLWIPIIWKSKFFQFKVNFWPIFSAASIDFGTFYLSVYTPVCAFSDFRSSFRRSNDVCWRYTRPPVNSKCLYEMIASSAGDRIKICSLLASEALVHTLQQVQTIQTFIEFRCFVEKKKFCLCFSKQKKSLLLWITQSPLDFVGVSLVKMLLFIQRLFYCCERVWSTCPQCSWSIKVLTNKLQILNLKFTWNWFWNFYKNFKILIFQNLPIWLIDCVDSQKNNNKKRWSAININHDWTNV